MIPPETTPPGNSSENLSNAGGESEMEAHLREFPNCPFCKLEFEVGADDQ